MNLTLKLLAACAALSLAAISFSGCGGNDCATGTKESDGQCIPDTTTCGSGTTLVNGRCQLDDTGCGAGASLDSTGKCVADAPTGEECGDGTTFDAGTGKCTPTSVITCGANTKNEGGKCVPDAGICAAGTKLNTDGQCVIDAPACGAGTQLDPNTAKCVVTDQICGANTAFDAASGTCKTADTVCAAGTTFSTDTGLCLPEATCQMGDVIVEGKCVSASQALASMATVTSTENDDPNYMGTPNALTIPATQGDKVVAKGTINAPVDLDADGTPDQDLDYYTIQGTAGQHISVDLAVIAGPSMSFALIGPDGPENYIRISGQGAKRGASRSFLIPKDGEYSLVVVPSISLLEGDAGPFGDDGWDYVLSVGNIDAPVSTDFDPALNNVAGSFGNLSDNLHKVANVAPGTLVDMTIEKVGKNVEGFVQVWNGPTAYVGEYPAIAGETYRVVMPSMGDTFLFFDWAAANGPQLDYEVSITPLPGQENLGAIPAAGTATSMSATNASGDTRYISFTLAAGEVAEITHTNDENGTYNVEVSGPNGSTVFTDSTFAAQGATSPERAYIYSPNGGTYVVIAEANGTRTNGTFTVSSQTPVDQGMLAIGGMLNIDKTGTPLATEAREHFRVNLPADTELTGILDDNGGTADADFYIYNATTGQSVYTGSASGDETISAILAAGDYIFQVHADSELATGYTLNLSAAVAPLLEIEPNNTTATATPLMIPSEVVGTGGWGTNVPKEWSANNTPFDYFSFTLAQDLATNEFLSLTLKSIGAVDPSEGTFVIIYDSTGAEIDRSATSGLSKLLKLSSLTAGTYYIGIAVSFDTSYNTLYKLGLAITTIPTEALGAIAANASASTTPSAVAANGEYQATFTAAAGEVIEITQTNDENAVINLKVIDAMGSSVFSDTSFNTPAPATASSAERAYFYVPVGGDYKVVVSSTAARTNSVITVKSITPNALGSFNIGQQIVGTQAAAVAPKVREFHSVTLNANSKLVGSLSAGALYLYDNTGALVSSYTTSTAIANLNINAAAGDYILAIEAPTAGLPSGYTLTLDAQTPPMGNVCATATPIAMSGTFMGNTAGYTNNYSPGTFSNLCTGYVATGLDVTYVVNLTAGQVLDVTLSGSVDTSLYIVSDCSDTVNSCLVGDDVSGQAESVSYTALGNETVFIIVDAYSNTTGYTYTLDVQLN